MHIREVKVKHKDIVHRYTQIVQSYRRSDGMPAHKVIAGLGELPPQTVLNLKAALAASRDNKAITLPLKEAEVVSSMPVLANLRYLDIALALQIWHSWGLSDLFKVLMPIKNKDIPNEKIIAALVIQRCVAPRSKLYAQKWFPTTALPELLDISPRQFNNTRIHRVLDELNRTDKKLQSRLPQLYQASDGAFLSLFLDVTDTYFEGNGCEMAARSRTKEGMRNKRCVGLMLLCNQKGYPLQWEVLPGKQRDPQSMTKMVKQIKKLPWASKVPLVCDRAMGKESSVKELFKSGMWFLTAVPLNEIESYTNRIPYERFVKLKLGNRANSYDADVRIVCKTALQAGMEKVDECLYVLDLGCYYKGKVTPSNNESQTFFDSTRLVGSAAVCLAQAIAIQKQLDGGEKKTQSDIANTLHLSRTRISQLMALLRLAPDIQKDILSGRAGNIAEHLLRPLCSIDSQDEQRKKFDTIVNKIPPGKRKQTVIEKKPEARKIKPIKARLITYFNPQMFVEQRAREEEHLQEMYDFEKELNVRLASPRSRRGKDSIKREILAKLERRCLVSCFRVRIGKKQGKLAVKLHLIKREWEQRRRYDGFVMLLAHPALAHKASELALLYRGKDAIEKDFQTIKSVVKLRPIYHYTNSKVRAHVTLCMLALLIERTLEQKLAKTSEKSTAPVCFETLSTCQLNKIASHGSRETVYTITRPTSAQRNIVEALDMKYIINNDEITKNITRPR